MAHSCGGLHRDRISTSTMERIEPSLETGINQASSHKHDDDSITAAIITAAFDADRDDVRDLCCVMNKIATLSCAFHHSVQTDSADTLISRQRRSVLELAPTACQGTLGLAQTTTNILVPLVIDQEPLSV